MLFKHCRPQNMARVGFTSKGALKYTRYGAKISIEWRLIGLTKYGETGELKLHKFRFLFRME